MAFARASAVRTALRATRAARPALSKPQAWQKIGRRSYASGGHDAVKSSSDLPWAAGAVLSSVAGSAWLLSGEKPAHEGHDDHHGEKHEEHEEESEEASQEEGGESEKSEESKDEPKEDSEEETKDEAKEESKEENTDDSGSESEAEADTPDTSDDEKVGETDKNTKLQIQDAKGGFKKRLESKNSIKQGHEDDTADSSAKDKAAASKEPGSKNSTSGKQEGLTNTDTKHSTDIKAEGKSMKGEGIPETAKAKGTVDPRRPQV